MEYRTPLTDIRFAMQDVLDYESHYAALPAAEDASPELVDSVLQEYARFCEEVIAPLNRSGDEEGCHWNDGEVSTPAGYKEAYAQFAEAGWPSLSCDPAYGGQGLPPSLSRILAEILGSASTGFSLYTSAQAGAIETLSTFGSPEQRALYESKLVSSAWNATMCLTEPHCGTDLGLLRSRAEPRGDGSYAISGTKIFITGGEHDLNENIVHMVLARLPDAPPGTKGISLFIVPKFLPDSDGAPGARNQLSCGSIEQKMGIKASSTCVMNFDGATGYMLGEPNRGLGTMFTFVNTSRLAAAVQGVTHAELGFQKSLAYARERLQMRALTGPRNPASDADPIIVHPDVRRMLLIQKAFAEGNRLLVYYLAKQSDLAECSASQDERDGARQRLDFMTPIAKAFATETGFEAANLALQCFGGHGYIREWGVEQNVRDARIAMLYEGTTGIQALDLLSRKVLGSGGSMLTAFTREITPFCEGLAEHPILSGRAAELAQLLQEWHSLTEMIGEKALENPDEIGASSVNYLMYSGYVCLAYFWLQAMACAEQKLNESPANADFYEAKILTGHFYFDHILPRTRACVGSIEAGAQSMMALAEDHFRF